MTASDAPVTLWVLGLTLVMLAGLNAPLAGLALGLAVASLQIVVVGELRWLVEPPMLWVWSALLVAQFLADLFFVPATVRDRAYVHSQRFVNAHLHTRFQSLVRPFVGALALAALPLGVQAQMAATVGFVLGTAVYWTTAWIREHVAVSRGSVILLILEMTKNVTGLMVVWLASIVPTLALVMLGSWLVPVVLWTARLQREQSAYSTLGGQIAQDDP
jgi:hypothetical protein